MRVGRSGRGILLAGAWLLAAGCAERPGDAGAVAQVGEWTLTSTRLADLLVLGQPLGLDTATVDALVDHWVAVAALAQRAGAGADLRSPDAVRASLWLERREALLEADRVARLGPPEPASDAEARASFEADTLKLLAHVLRATTEATSAGEEDLQRRTADAVHRDLLAGGSWAAAVARSEDASTRDESGLLGLVRPDELPTPLQGAARALEPGQISSVLRSPAGFHILYRPRWADVGPLYARLLAEHARSRRDAAALDAMADSLGIAVETEALPAVREWAAGRSPATVPDLLARWAGGGLGADAAEQWVAALPDEARRELAATDDEDVRRFLADVAAREARIARAVAGGLTLDPTVERELEALHAAEVDAWASELDGGSAAPAYSRQALARYMERLVSRQIALRPVPPLLERWLLADAEWRVDRRASRSAGEAARRMITAAEGREDAG
ncbi:MAG: peptidylprolyl isomerase [Longimicrobiales bacterium]